MASRSEQAAIGRGLADFDQLASRVNDPREAGAAGKEILEPLVQLPAARRGREDLDGEVGGALVEPRRGTAETLEPGPGDKGDVRGAAVPALHPEAGARIPDRTQAVQVGEGLQGGQEPRANLAVLPVVLRAHDQLTVDDFVEVAVLGQGLQLSLRPRLGGRRTRRGARR